jgi:hypothetical protein
MFQRNTIRYRPHRCTEGSISEERCFLKTPRQDKGPSYGLHKGDQDDKDNGRERGIFEEQRPKPAVAFNANHAREQIRADEVTSVQVHSPVVSTCCGQRDAN